MNCVNVQFRCNLLNHWLFAKRLCRLDERNKNWKNCKWRFFLVSFSISAIFNMKTLSGCCIYSQINEYVVHYHSCCTAFTFTTLIQMQFDENKITYNQMHKAKKKRKKISEIKEIDKITLPFAPLHLRSQPKIAHEKRKKKLLFDPHSHCIYYWKLNCTFCF